MSASTVYFQEVTQPYLQIKDIEFPPCHLQPFLSDVLMPSIFPPMRRVIATIKDGVVSFILESGLGR